MSKEFRNVSAARELLAQYIESGRDIRLIEKVNQISRYDVWLCVFEQEKEAYKALQQKELYSTLFGMGDNVPTIARICVNYIFSAYEFKTPLSPSEILNICVDVFGKPFLKIIRKTAKQAMDQRIKIVSRYKEIDNEWIGFSKETLSLIDNLSV